jgi:hypothetical protein
LLDEVVGAIEDGGELDKATTSWSDVSTGIAWQEGRCMR